MIGLMPLHGAGEIRSGVILSTAGDYCVTENFPAALPNFFGLLCSAAPLNAPQHIQQFKRFDIGYWFFANVRENIFVESFQDV